MDEDAIFGVAVPVRRLVRGDAVGIRCVVGKAARPRDTGRGRLYFARPLAPGCRDGGRTIGAAGDAGLVGDTDLNNGLLPRKKPLDCGWSDKVQRAARDGDVERVADGQRRASIRVGNSDFYNLHQVGAFKPLGREVRRAQLQARRVSLRASAT